MVVRCPHLLLSDVRNVVVPSLLYLLRCTTDHDELGKRLFRDPALLLVSSKTDDEACPVRIRGQSPATRPRRVRPARSSTIGRRQ